MLFGAGLLILAAAFVAARGPSRRDEISEDALDGDLDGVAPARLLQPASL